MNTKGLLLITVFMTIVGSLSAMNIGDKAWHANEGRIVGCSSAMGIRDQALHNMIVDKTKSQEIQAGNVADFGGIEYRVEKFFYEEDYEKDKDYISYELRSERKLLNFHWATDTFSYKGPLNGSGTLDKPRNYNYRNIATAGVFLAGCVALARFAWVNLMPAQENG